MTGNTIYAVVHERCDMMMMLKPTQIFQQETNHLSGYCFPSMIRHFTKLTSDVCKVVLDDF